MNLDVHMGSVYKIVATIHWVPQLVQKAATEIQH